MFRRVQNGTETLSVAIGINRPSFYAAFESKEALFKRVLDRYVEGPGPADLARYVWTFCHGMAVQAAGGASRADLRRVAAEFLKTWPSP